MKLMDNMFRILSGLAFVLTAIPDAQATTITYSFSVTATTGPLSGLSALGTFSYDSSSIIPGGNNNTGLLTALDFTWNGITYNQTTANTGFLNFDGSGALTSAGFGTNCTAGGCNVFPYVDGWLITADTFQAGFFGYATPGTLGGQGTVSTTATPEPSTLALLCIGLGGLVTKRLVRERSGGLAITPARSADA